ncbi:NADPH:quinone reductase-like Zn-dependent oxidoreductase [Lacibacter cauensis]|uniref:NADPH:quinone reductase-like Zn-dependent oxidoreductase n=1 Tax=Lacibacter cauensis TaxID=510947 RepID=A0A562SWW7_9BACT|nr:NAD(P)-dependent alcohol dehydrogenase [Lacibacter cauensis]TWI85787.1 NADPH:quinone reductase-like Zn-dependent oxidoreductase [Lacibacter cauensis]
MKAIMYDRYGDPGVFYSQQTAQPVPESNEVLIKIYASSVTAGEIKIRKGQFQGSLFFTIILRLLYGLFKPRRKISGFEFAGVVEATGSAVTRFKNGDAVFGTTTGLQHGAYAEYICVPETRNQGVVMLKPDYLSFEAAAVLPIGAMTALQLLQKVKIKPGDTVLVYGASGSVGSYAVQIAEAFGAKVTAVCRSVHHSWVRSIGAHELMDYTGDELRHCRQRFDIVLDAVAKVKPDTLRRLLKKGGRFCSVKSYTRERLEDLELIVNIAGQGKLKPFIDRVYSLDQMTEAHHYVELGHKKGNVVIRCLQTETALANNV